MVVKSQIKLIKSLQQKKYRNEHGMFVVEGIKTINELLESDFEVAKIYATEPHFRKFKSEYTTEVSLRDFEQISGLKNPNGVLGIFRMPKPVPVAFKDWIVALDDIRDPGNLGTIIRLCDWFGIKHLVCSINTVDCYNPKVLQATMGSISRVNVVYCDLAEFLSKSDSRIYGAFMEGATVYKEELPEKGVLVLGNEANGISREIEELVHSKIGIPQFGQITAESLNVATAGAILLNEIRRS